MPVAVAELAKRLDATATWLSEPDAHGLVLEDIALPKAATGSSLSFLYDSGTAGDLDSAGAVLVEAGLADLVAKPMVVDNVPLAIAHAYRWLPIKNTGLPSSDDGVPQIHPSAYLETGVEIGRHVALGPNSALFGEVRIGDYCSIGPNVAIHGPVAIGNRVKIEANSVIGSEAFMFIDDGLKWHKWPSFCGVKINDGVEIGACTTIDRGLTRATSIGNDVKIDNQVHIGHGVIIGNDTVIAGRTTVAGESAIGARCKIGGACCINEGLSIADGVTVMGSSAVTRTLDRPGEYVGAWPVQARREWWRQLANLKLLAKDRRSSSKY